MSSDGVHAAYTAIWPGLGGNGNVQLVQAGTEQNAAPNQAQTDYFWFEAVPQNPYEVQVSNLVPRVGDDVAADVFWMNGTFEFGLCDYTLKTCVTGTESIPQPGNTVEWIVERPTLSNGSYGYLAKYPAITFLNAYWGETPQGSAEYPMATGSSQLFMTTGAGKTLAYGANATGTTFTDYWTAYS